MLSIVLKLAQPLNVEREARIQENLAMSQENNSLASEPNTNLEQTINEK
jgi:hypothetical protein